MRTIAPTQNSVSPAKNRAAQNESDGGGRSVSYKQEIETLKRSLQEQRRATTLLNAEVQRQIEAREAMEAQLIEANAEIAASWERRKEMARVIGNARSEIKANRERRKEMARVISNRDAKIVDLRAQLQVRYEELAALQRHLLNSSLSGKAKRLVRQLTRLFRQASQQNAR